MLPQPWGQVGGEAAADPSLVPGALRTTLTPPGGRLTQRLDLFLDYFLFKSVFKK